MLKTISVTARSWIAAYHLGEGRVLKTSFAIHNIIPVAYHLGEGRVLKTILSMMVLYRKAYHLGEGRVLKTRVIFQK